MQTDGLNCQRQHCVVYVHGSKSDNVLSTPSLLVPQEALEQHPALSRITWSLKEKKLRHQLHSISVHTRLRSAQEQEDEVQPGPAKEVCTSFGNNVMVTCTYKRGGDTCKLGRGGRDNTRKRRGTHLRECLYSRCAKRTKVYDFCARNSNSNHRLAGSSKLEAFCLHEDLGQGSLTRVLVLSEKSRQQHGVTLIFSMGSCKIAVNQVVI